MQLAARRAAVDAVALGIVTRSFDDFDRVTGDSDVDCCNQMG
jgi:hypothetical protein